MSSHWISDMIKLSKWRRILLQPCSLVDAGLAVAAESDLVLAPQLSAGNVVDSRAPLTTVEDGEGREDGQEVTYEGVFQCVDALS